MTVGQTALDSSGINSPHTANSNMAPGTMSTDAPTTGEEQAPSTDDAEIRKQAVKRSYVCPGAGFALIGHSGWAMVTFVVTLCGLVAAAWLSFRPTAASFWTTAALIVIATILWLAEQIAVKKAPIRSPGPPLLVKGYLASSGLMWLALIAVLVLLVTAFGSFQMAASGMSPTLKIGERLIYHKHVDRHAVQPGAVIAYRNADDSGWGQPGYVLISRVLAGPGDTISIQNGRYVVSGATGPGVAETGRFDVVLDIPSAPESLTIPDGCYFIVQESPTGGLDSRVLSWVRSENIVATRLWYFSSRGIGKPVE